MEIYNNIFCISKPDLTDGDPLASSVKERPVMSESALHIYLHRYPHIRIRKGGGHGCPALLNYEHLRTDIKQRIHDKYGDIRQYARRNRLQEMMEPDLQASSYFAGFLFDDETGIRPEKQAEYNANATALNAIGKLLEERTGKMRKMGIRTAGMWEQISEAVNALDRTRYPHTLPANALRLKDKFRNYRDHGYQHLIHKGNRNANARKTNEQVERLIISLYCMRNIPFGTWVYDNYLQFLSGSLMVVDRETGMMYDRDDFSDHDRGSYITISRSTVWNIINNPANQVIIDRLRNNRIDHVTKNTPYNHRKLPKFSLSKISIDDRTLSRKTTDGKPFNAYVAVDVLSDVWLSCVYTTESPSESLVWQCLREMYRTISDHNLMWPGEIETENFIIKHIEQPLREMFGYLTVCAPGISRSKRAEHKIRSKKYEDEKRNQEGIGRWYGKGAYKVKSENKDEQYKQPRLPVEQLIAEDRQSIQRYNHALHPNQKMFPGKTRWQVLLENMNPDLGRPQRHKIFRYLGLRTETSIRNNDFVTVQYEKYTIDNLAALERLKPNNHKVEAFYVPAADGSISEVFLYQGDTFLTRASRIERYNEAKMERTDEDERIRTDQAKRQSHFFKVERDGIREKVTKVELVRTDQMPVDIVPEIIDIPQETSEIPLDGMAFRWTPEEMRRRALDEI